MRRLQLGWRPAKPTNWKHKNLASIRRKKFSTPMTKRIQARHYSFWISAEASTKCEADASEIHYARTSDEASTPLMARRWIDEVHGKQRTKNKFSLEPKNSKLIYRRFRPSVYTIFREFDPGSGQTLAACLTHASRTECLRLKLRQISLVT